MENKYKTKPQPPTYGRGRPGTRQKFAVFTGKARIITEIVLDMPIWIACYPRLLFMQAMQDLYYNSCNIFVIQRLPATYTYIYENKIRTCTKSIVLSFSPSVAWFYITIFFLDSVQYSFKALAEGEMTAWLIIAFTCKVLSMPESYSRDSLFPLFV